MSIFEIKFKHRFLYNIATFVLLSHFFLFFIFSFLNKPLKIAFLVNKSAVNLSFKVDYMQKRTAKKIDSDKLKTKNLKSAKSKLTKIEKPITKEVLKEKLKEEYIKEEFKEDLIEEELIIGRQELEELKLTLQMHDKVQSFWKPPQGLKPNKASKWSLTIEKNGKRKVEKIESSGILAFDMAAQRSLMLVDIKITVPVLILEVAFTG